MALPKEDNTLVKAVLVFAILMIVGYYMPSWGYKETTTKLDTTKQELDSIRKEYEKVYPKPSPAVWGEPPGMYTESTSPGPTMSKRSNEYKRALSEVRDQIALQQEASRMQFAPWTDVPKEWSREPGVYFSQRYTDLRYDLENACRKEDVYLDDRKIGFEQYKGGVIRDASRAEELLRELYIADTVIRLCIKSKTEQYKDEQKRGLKPEAYMRILEVTPEPSVETGPYKQKLNPLYEQALKKKGGKAQKWDKYITEEFTKFIREYPIQIKLECDVHSFMRFLYKVRSKGQFLVIRQLEILSPFMEDSLLDQSEMRNYGISKENRKDLNDNHILVTLSAAGMDFFDPDNRGGEAGKSNVKRRPAKRAARPMGH